jgi:hypothetical protein
VITAGTDNSVQQFCAYHNTAPFNAAQNLRYAVMPYSTNDSGCGASDGIGNTESVASHELIEAVTDPDVGLAPSLAPPLSWYDQITSGLGEIGDICNAQQANFTGTDAFQYKVQLEWSNQNNVCEAAGAPRTISVGDASVVEGDTATRYLSFPVTLSSVSNHTETVQYTLQGAPTAAMTAIAGADFTASSGTVSFNAVNDRTPAIQYIKVPIIGDTTIAPTKQLRVVLSHASVGYAIARSTGYGTIIRDDPVAFKYLAISVGDTTVYVGQHGNREVLLPITLSRPWLGPLAMKWEILNTSTAAHNIDWYGPTTGIAIIPAATIGIPLTITIYANANFNGPEQIYLTISSLPAPYNLPPGIGINRPTGTGTLKAG